MAIDDDVPPPEEDGGTGEPAEEGAPMWIVTFSDLMSLLLTFFILLYSLSELKMERFMLAAQSLNAAMGSTSPEPVENPAGLMKDPTDPDVQLENPGLSPGANITPVPSDGAEDSIVEHLAQTYMEIIEQRLNEYVSEAGLDSDVSVERAADGVYMRMQAQALFAPGSAAPQGDGVEILTGLAEVTSSFAIPMIVSGHADNRPISNATFASNWELSAARAAGVAYRLTQAGQDPSLTRVEAFGEFKPIADNETVEGRAENRRVELYFSLAAIQAVFEELAGLGLDGSAMLDAVTGGGPAGDGAADAEGVVDDGSGPEGGGGGV